MVGRWPCYFFQSDTTGEKDFEEFFTRAKKKSTGTALKPNWGYQQLSSIRCRSTESFEEGCSELLRSGQWSKDDL